MNEARSKGGSNIVWRCGVDWALFALSGVCAVERVDVYYATGGTRHLYAILFKTRCYVPGRGPGKIEVRILKSSETIPQIERLVLVKSAKLKPPESGMMERYRSRRPEMLLSADARVEFMLSCIIP